MDAESRRRRRESSISLREQRWSMSSQRLEQIVAALMKPVSHYGQSFDRDDSGLLEEYLTTAGVRALEAEEAGQEAPPPPNYAEMGLVIQSFANNYCKKVDHLSRLVNSFSQTLDSNNVLKSSDMEEELSSPPGASLAGVSRRPRTSSVSGAGFSPISLTTVNNVRREIVPGGPPPTLPRVYAELQPRVSAPERVLPDYEGEPIGALDDFRAAWRLHDGYLVEELVGGSTPGASLRPLSLMELQEACARAAAPAPAPPPLSPGTPPATPRSPSPPSTTPPVPTAPSPQVVAPPAGLRRKRRSEAHIEDLVIGSLNFDMDEAMIGESSEFSEFSEFSVSVRWLRRVVKHRRDIILEARREHAHKHYKHSKEFRGFDMSWMDIGGFAGWSGAESSAARLEATRLTQIYNDLTLRDRDSHSIDHHYADGDDALISEDVGSNMAGTEAWQREVTRRAAINPALHLPTLARDVSNVLPAAPGSITWTDLATATSHTQPQLARVLLDVLMKATRGEVEIEQGPPLSVGQFSVRTLAEPPSSPSPSSPSPPPPSPPSSPEDDS